MLNLSWLWQVWPLLALLDLQDHLDLLAHQATQELWVILFLLSKLKGKHVQNSSQNDIYHTKIVSMVPTLVFSWKPLPLGRVWCSKPSGIQKELWHSSYHREIFSWRFHRDGKRYRYKFNSFIDRLWLSNENIKAQWAEITNDTVLILFCLCSLAV